jgi:hypothetical protein
MARSSEELEISSYNLFMERFWDSRHEDVRSLE